MRNLGNGPRYTKKHIFKYARIENEKKILHRRRGQKEEAMRKRKKHFEK